MNNITKKIFSILRFAMATAMLYYLIQSGAINWSSFEGFITHWEYTLLALSLFIIGTILQARRLFTLINVQQLTLSLFASIRLTFIGLYFNAFLPGSSGGDLVKIYYACKGNPGNRTKVITILLFDRFIGLFSLLTLPLIFAPFFIELIVSEIILQVLLGISFIIAIGIITVSIVGAKIDLANNRFMLWIEENIFLGKLLSKVLHIVHSYRHNQVTILKALLYSYSLQIIMIGVSLAVVIATSSNGIDLKMAMLIPLGYLANSLPITPGGLGVGEAALESLFSISGLRGGAETLLGWRMMMFASGLIGLLFYLKGGNRFVYSHEKKQEHNSESTSS